MNRMIRHLIGRTMINARSENLGIRNDIRHIIDIHDSRVFNHFQWIS